MKNKNNSLLKACHLILIIAGLGLCIYGFNFGDIPVLDTITLVLKIAALISSFFYLTKGYKKEADLYYKVFMWMVGVFEIVGYTSFLTKGTVLSVFQGFVSILTFVAFILIIGAHDYGKVKSSIISITLVILTGYTAISMLISTNILRTQITSICQFVFALIAGIMVIAKYNDKDSRGAK